MTDVIEELLIKENDLCESVNGSNDIFMEEIIYDCKYNSGTCNTLSYGIKASKHKCCKTFLIDIFFQNFIQTTYKQFKDEISVI